MKILDSFKWMGPGLLYAAAAIGVSHLVQSTRAGASFGYELVWAVILANFFKYPFFKFGPLYTLATDESLLLGYKRIGRSIIYLFFIATLGTMFTVQAAVTVVTAGLASKLVGLSVAPASMSLILLIICSIILIIGNYKFLDNLIKLIIVILTLTTLFAVFSTFSLSIPNEIQRESFSFSKSEHIFFLIALIGWMPGPLDIPIWQSLWTLEKKADNDGLKNIKKSLLDFNIGFIGTAILAVFFLILGAEVMYPSALEFSDKANEFSSQLINLYTQSIGHWAYPIILICAFSTMFSTTLTCLDAFPRILREGVYVLKDDAEFSHKGLYIFFLVLTVFGASIILFQYMTSMKGLVDFATTLSFLVAPFFAYLNFKVMYLPIVPKEFRPKKTTLLICYLGLIFLLGFAFYYLYLRFIS